MAKIAFLAVSEDMIRQAKKVIKNIDVDVEMKFVRSEEALSEAKISIENGANVIITRGNHVSLITRNTNIPVVEIVLTGQEIAKLIQEAKEILKKPNPVIAIVAFKNMVGRTSLFDEILDVTIKEYFVKYTEELEKAVENAVSDGVDFIIGGKIVNTYAKALGIPTMFLKSREDSIREAFRIAEKLTYAIDLEKRNTAEFKTVLDYSFDGIIKLNNEGRVVLLNYLAEKILRKSSEEVIGKHITEVINTLDESVLNDVFTKGKGVYYTLLERENLALVSNIAPIIIDNKVEGAILSLQEFKKIEELEAKIRNELYSKGYVAKCTFKQIIGESLKINEIKAMAKFYAKYDSPILITGESGTGKKMLAQSIHNESLRRNNPYVFINCASMPSEELEKRLYGSLEVNYGRSSPSLKKGVFEIAHTGTILLDKISELDVYGQASLFRVLKENSIVRKSDDRILPVNVRIICASDKNIINLVREGKFDENLFYMLDVLSLKTIPLRERKEDILVLLDYFIEEYNNMYKKYVVLTDGAKALISSYSWYGNANQLKKFCEKIIILAQKKVLNEDFINQHLESYVNIPNESKYDIEDRSKKIVVYENPEATKILELLDKHGGNRGEVAEELKISKTTLWRKIKKYKINTINL